MGCNGFVGAGTKISDSEMKFSQGNEGVEASKYYAAKEKNYIHIHIDRVEIYILIIILRLHITEVYLVTQAF